MCGFCNVWCIYCGCFVMCGCSDNCVGAFVMCTYIYCVLCCLYCVFVVCTVYTYVYLFLFVLSVLV